MNRPIQSTSGFHLSGEPIVFQPPIKVRRKKSAFRTKAGKSGKIMFDTSKARYHRQRAGIGRPTRNIQRRSNDIGRDYVGEGIRRPQQQNPIIILQEQQREAQIDRGVRKLEAKERKQKIKLERTPLKRRVKQEQEAYRQMRDAQQEASFLAQGLSPIGLPIEKGEERLYDEDDPEPVISRGAKIKQEAFARGAEAFRQTDQAIEIAKVLAELEESEEEVVSVKPSVAHARAQRRERRQERRKALIEAEEVDVPLLRTPEDPLRERSGGLQRDVPAISYTEEGGEQLSSGEEWVAGEGED